MFTNFTKHFPSVDNTNVPTATSTRNVIISALHVAYLRQLAAVRHNVDVDWLPMLLASLHLLTEWHCSQSRQNCYHLIIDAVGTRVAVQWSKKTYFCHWPAGFESCVFRKRPVSQSSRPIRLQPLTLFSSAHACAVAKQWLRMRWQYYPQPLLFRIYKMVNF